MVLQVMMNNIDHICGLDDQTTYAQTVLLPSLHKSHHLHLLTHSLTHLLPTLSSSDWSALGTWFLSFASLFHLLAAAQQHPTLSALLEKNETLAAAFQEEGEHVMELKQGVVQMVVDRLAEAMKADVVEEVLLTEYYTYSDYKLSLDDHAMRAIQRAQERLEQDVTLIRNSIPEERTQTGIVFRSLRLLDKEVKNRTLFIHYNRVLCWSV